jgi:hypothetical protein
MGKRRVRSSDVVHAGSTGRADRGCRKGEQEHSCGYTSRERLVAYCDFYVDHAYRDLQLLCPGSTRSLVSQYHPSSVCMLTFSGCRYTAGLVSRKRSRQCHWRCAVRKSKPVWSPANLATTPRRGYSCSFELWKRDGQGALSRGRVCGIQVLPGTQRGAIVPVRVSGQRMREYVVF